MTTKHTATPETWEDILARVDLSGLDENPVEALKKAAFIVRACNAHDDLVKALKRTQAILFMRSDKSDVEATEAIGQALDALTKAGAR